MALPFTFCLFCLYNRMVMFCKVYREIGIRPGIPYVIDRSKPDEKVPDDPQDTDAV